MTNVGHRAAANRLREFDAWIARHRAQEERLFPALLESMAGSDPVCLREMIEALKADHRALEAAWRRVRAALERVPAGEPVSVAELAPLIALHQRHIEREQSELLPMAERLLGEQDFARLAGVLEDQV